MHTYYVPLQFYFDSDFENDDVFASPTPVRRITRGRKGKHSSTKPEDESMKKSLTKELDVDSQEEVEKPRTTSTRATRSRVRERHGVTFRCSISFNCPPRLLSRVD